MNKQPAAPFGRVTAVHGPVVDIAFAGALPEVQARQEQTTTEIIAFSDDVT